MKQIVGRVAPLLRRAGFKKRRHTFNRTNEPGIVHVVNFQMGSFNPPGAGSAAHSAALESLGIPGDLYGRFTINVGVYFAGMVIDEHDKPGGWVNDYNCQLRQRIGDLLTGEDVWWALDSPDEVLPVVETALTEAALPWLDGFPSTSSVADAFVRDGWTGLGMAPRGPLEIAWLLKDTRRGEAEALIRSYVAEDVSPGHKEWVERHLKRAGLGHLLAPF
jgi:hypothetical protein